jgi:hypothetical protein
MYHNYNSRDECMCMQETTELSYRFINHWFNISGCRYVKYILIVIDSRRWVLVNVAIFEPVDPRKNMACGHSFSFNIIFY